MRKAGKASDQPFSTIVHKCCLSCLLTGMACRMLHLRFHTQLLPYLNLEHIVYVCFSAKILRAFHNFILQHPVALHRSDFVFCFYAVYVQHRLLFTHRFSLLTPHVSA
jgi:hypothetical protein